MGGGINKDVERALTPHLKVILRDRLRGTRKITWPHGFKGDPFLQRCFEQYVIGRSGPRTKRSNSFMSLVENNMVFSAMYERHVKTTALHGIVVKNLHLAHHRADSTQVPLGRFTLTHVALMRTAEDIVKTRTGEDRECAIDFLTSQSGAAGAEDMLMMGMLADAGDEAMILQRFTDDDELDPAEPPFECRAFLDRIEYLFGKEAG